MRSETASGKAKVARSGAFHAGFRINTDKN
jgi:hypothetical protein